MFWIKPFVNLIVLLINPNSPLMRLLLVFIFVLSISATAYAQQDTINLNEVTVKKKRTKKKKNNKFSNLNLYKVDVHAPNLFQAIRKHLGNARFDKEANKVILLMDRIYAPTSGSKYAIWVVDGDIYGEGMPPGLDFNSIRKVRVLKTVLETSQYGFRGSSGVIEITTANKQN